MSPAEVLKLIKERGLKLVDFKFVDLLGQWQHTTMPIHRLKEESFTEGFGFDGSSIRGWKAIHESDMIFVPDASTACVDPFFKEPTLSLICDIVDAVTQQPYSRDPRYVAKKAEALGERFFFEPVDRHRGVLPLTQKIDEFVVNELESTFLDQFQNLGW